MAEEVRGWEGGGTFPSCLLPAPHWSGWAAPAGELLGEPLVGQRLRSAEVDCRGSDLLRCDCHTKGGTNNTGFLCLGI